MKTTTPRWPLIGLGLALTPAACTKSEGAAATADPPPAASAAAEPSATTAPSAAAEPSATTAPEVHAAAADAAPPSKTKDGGSATAAKLQPAKAHVEGNHFALELASPGCRAGAECAMSIRLVPSADYHVNKEYPYKFVATPAPGITFLGKAGDPAAFSKATGDFVQEGERAATMTVRFKPTASANALK